MHDLTKEFAFPFVDRVLEWEGVDHHTCKLVAPDSDYWKLMEFPKQVEKHNEGEGMPVTVYELTDTPENFANTFQYTHDYFERTCYSGIYVYDVDWQKLCVSFVYEGMIHKTYHLDYKEYFTDHCKAMDNVTCVEYELPEKFHREIAEREGITNMNITTKLIPITT